MMMSRELRIGPALKTGDRIVLAISRQTKMTWPGGCTGNCTPVALVIVEGEECTVWQLGGNAAIEEIKDTLAGIAEPLTLDAPITRSCL